VTSFRPFGKRLFGHKEKNLLSLKKILVEFDFIFFLKVKITDIRKDFLTKNLFIHISDIFDLYKISIIDYFHYIILFPTNITFF
jgi:hypothetical protein